MSSSSTVQFDERILKPPPVPADRVYTANYCEENIYLLAQRFLEVEEVRATWSVYVIVISNDTRTVALWSQKLGEDVVVWDYHVILALKPRVSSATTGRQTPCTGSDGSTWIYDLDTRLDTPCPWEEYVSRTFPYLTSEAVEAGWTISQSYQSMLRIVDGGEFLSSFASDRSHMVVSDSEHDTPRYKSPEPPYPCIRGAKAAALGVTNNLMSSFVCMDTESSGIGRVYTLEQAYVFFQ